MPLALGLEMALRKEQILEMYLNGMSTWGRRGRSASPVWRRQPAGTSTCRWTCCGCPRPRAARRTILAPNLYDLIEHPAEARVRRDEVLNDMVAAGVLSRARRGLALPLYVRQVSRRRAFPAVLRLRPLPHRRGPAAQRGGGLGARRVTTLDIVGQARAEHEVTRALARLGRRLEGAFVATDPTTGAVRVSRAARDRRRRLQPRLSGAPPDGIRDQDRLRRRAVRRQRLVLAGQHGVGHRPHLWQGRHAWRPENYDGRYHESVTPALALAHSRNVATTNLVEMIGPRRSPISRSGWGSAA